MLRPEKSTVDILMSLTDIVTTAKFELGELLASDKVDEFEI